MLPLYTFISGYIWGYQTIVLKRTFTIKQLLVNKAKRLLIPCYLFGILYLVLSNNWLSLSKSKGIILFLSGEQHLWFLPMLFWCFIIAFIIDKIHIKEWKVLFFSFIALVLAWDISSLGILTAARYFFYFYLGVFFFKNKCNLILNKKQLATGWFIFFSLFILLTIIQTNINLDTTLKYKLIPRTIFEIQKHLMMAPIGILGTILCYECSLHLQMQRQAKLTNLVARNSFGIYIFHHFILTWIYSCPRFRFFTGDYLLPILGFIISFSLSLLITQLALKSSIGRKILG